MRIPTYSFVPIAAATFAWLFSVDAQNAPKVPLEQLAESSTATCYDKSSGRLVGPAKIRTFLLTSPDGSYRAYAENEALTHKVTRVHGEETLECLNTSRLFVAGPKSQEFRQILILSPSRELDGNSINLVDWSPNGHRLLIDEGLWVYEGDMAGTVIQLYDADSDRLFSNSFVEEAFRKHVGSDCFSVFRPMGFSPDGAVIVSAGPWFDVGEEQAADSCVPKEGLWLIDPPSLAISELPHNYQLRHFGERAQNILPSQSQQCSSHDLQTFLKANDPVYDETVQLSQTLQKQGYIVKCVLQSKMAGFFEGQKGAAVYRTNRGDFEALFLPKAQSFVSIQPIERREKDRYFYSFQGSPRPTSAYPMDCAGPMYFARQANQFFITEDKQLAASLDEILNSN